jgi:hypothetical protein
MIGLTVSYTVISLFLFEVRLSKEQGVNLWVMHLPVLPTEWR